jgi:hypothetical protein
MEDLEQYAEGTAAQLQALQVGVGPFRHSIFLCGIGKLEQGVVWSNAAKLVW